MILYKYVKLDRALKFLEKHTLRFTPALELNDPFELTASYYEGDDHDYNSPQNKDNFYRLSIMYGILSLSRSPLNPLMWAHYATGNKMPNPNGIDLSADNTSHGGMVIGIDVEKAGLNSLSYNILPAKCGSVIYTKTKPQQPFENSNDFSLLQGFHSDFKPDQIEALQRLFLYKSLEWSYEEEVRVIKNINRPPRDPAQKKELLYLDPDSVVEFYIGASHGYNPHAVEFFNKKIKEKFTNCKVYRCELVPKSWSLRSVDVSL
ncbi:DUF2971 domain-containing protein [Rosenbergiella epipactidis]|uniref:DUF2971 domain-containing protein n=1 Tax=Rosenbergiella epipactidis TaxID=1544694 RepID=UPI001F4E32C5|nr:DUF2971 domain-containing protein [Rosenbergiella epipactidis]